MIAGTCHCGRIRIAVPAPPPYGNACQCSLCRRYGVIWGYFHPSEVRIEAAGDGRASYSWGERSLSFGRCAGCGTVTDWQAIGEESPDRMAVNLRLFEPSDVAGVPVRESPGPA